MYLQSATKVLRHFGRGKIRISPLSPQATLGNGRGGGGGKEMHRPQRTRNIELRAGNIYHRIKAKCKGIRRRGNYGKASSS